MELTTLRLGILLFPYLDSSSGGEARYFFEVVKPKEGVHRLRERPLRNRVVHLNLSEYWIARFGCQSQQLARW